MFSPAKNLNVFLRTSPPVIVFTICLLALAISTYSFAFYIEQQDLIIDSDYLEDWIQMKKHFNQLKICIHDKKQNISNNRKNDLIEETSIFKKADIGNAMQLQKFENIEGDLSLTDWVSSCKKPNGKPDSIKISFLIPRTSSENVSHICIKLTGPVDYLPKFTESLCDFKDQPRNKRTGYLISSTIKNKKGCVNGTETNLSMDPKANDGFAVYLKPEEKNIIYFHLMWCSYVLVFIIIINLLYAIFHKHKTHIEDI